MVACAARMQRMCGRFVQSSDPAAYAEFFEARLVAEPLPVSYNVAPTDPVYAVAEHDGERLLGSFRWGLLPWWAKDRRIAARNINARAETLADKPAFRDSFAKRRCLIPADGFYEWQVIDAGEAGKPSKLPHYITRADGDPLAFAGLWASWKDPETGERVRTCTIVTGRPNTLVEPIHDRMPVMLPPANWESWLDPELDDPGALGSLLLPAPAAEMAAHPVSTLVNRVSNNVPECIAPLDSSLNPSHRS